jgi:predicted nucleic acid-binding protein
MADQMQGNDFEDNLQIACAVAGNMDIIVTRDLEGFRHSSIQVMTPSDFLSMLSISP